MNWRGEIERRMRERERERLEGEKCKRNKNNVPTYACWDIGDERHGRAKLIMHKCTCQACERYRIGRKVRREQCYTEAWNREREIGRKQEVLGEGWHGGGSQPSFGERGRREKVHPLTVHHCHLPSPPPPLPLPPSLTFLLSLSQ